MAKTLEEMREAIENYCEGVRDCEQCPLKPLPEDWCTSYQNEVNGKELLKKHYEILFGKEEPVDTKRTANDKVRITLTRHQCEAIAEFIEMELLNTIRADKEIDNVDWLADMMNAYVRLKKLGEYDD